MKSCALSLSVTSLILVNSISLAEACRTGGSITNVFGLGGSTLYVSALGARGELTGFSYLPGDTSAHAFQSLGGVITDLGTLGGGVSKANAISPSGAIVGDSSLPGEGATHAALFLNGSVIDLGTLGGTDSYGVAINSLNEIVGDSLIAGNGEYQAFFWSGGQMTALGSISGYGSYATDVNDAGVVIGDSYTEWYDIHAFFWTNGVMYEIGTFGGWDSTAVAINNAGLILGNAMTPENRYHAFLWNGGMVDLGTLGGDASVAVALNEAGQVIGTSALVADGPTRGFLYQNGQMVDLGTLGGSWAQPKALNNLGQIVGDSATAEGLTHAFLWENGVMTDLNTLLPAGSGWELNQAQYINDAGYIAGIGSYNGNACYFVFQRGGRANTAPQAVLAAVHSDACGDVTLDGSLSMDPDGGELSFAWYKEGVLLGTEPLLALALPQGVHEVVLQVSDECGAVGVATTMVVVADTTPPSINSVTADKTVLSPPSNQLVPVELTVVGEDNCSSFLSSRIVSVSSTGTGTEDDFQIVGDLSLLLRASKDPDGQERVYTITVATNDEVGNVATSEIQVRVPRNKSGKNK